MTLNTMVLWRSRQCESVERGLKNMMDLRSIHYYNTVFAKTIGFDNGLMSY
ncbi:hypothetical protein KHA80_06165 [Anaerobacillus sp. HL2]|nr:hypothetical protein KHA80_06165 [Anaerobacillus sp. HL2]